MEKTEIEKNYEVLENTLKALFPNKESKGKIIITIGALRKFEATSEELQFLTNEFAFFHKAIDFMPAELIEILNKYRSTISSQEMIYKRIKGDLVL